MSVVFLVGVFNLSFNVIFVFNVIVIEDRWLRFNSERDLEVEEWIVKFWIE